MIDVLHSLSHKVKIMLARRAYLHWFNEEGMEDWELTEALRNIEDLIIEYQQYSDVATETADEETQAARRAGHREHIKAPWHAETPRVSPAKCIHKVPMDLGRTDREGSVMRSGGKQLEEPDLA
ncbi:hypothetical protein EON65_34860 [archaeon]|nr:MAG: hypothetical protein EON65_34860 [archaeon]